MDETISLQDANGLIVLQSLNDPSKTYGGDLSGTVVLGRDSSQSNIVISDDPSVSKRHCSFYQWNGTCYVEDLGSHNHTYLNEALITSPAPVNQGDVLTVGMQKLKVIQLTVGGNNYGAGQAAGYGQDSYNQGGYSQGGYSQDSYNQGGYSQDSYNQGGYSQDSYTQGGYSQDSYNQGSYNQGLSVVDSGQGGQGSQSFQTSGSPNWIKKRNIVLAILFSIITCGIYGIYWMIKMNDEVNYLSGDTDATSGGMVFLFTIISCGIYGFYWMYRMGERCDKIRGVKGSSGILYLLLMFFGLGIVSYCLIQDTINKQVAA